MTDTTVCFKCGDDIAYRQDEWWQYSWEISPSTEQIDDAIDDPEFDEWFTANYVMCPECHDSIQEFINE